MPRGRQVALFASALVAVKLNLDGGFEGAYALSTRERKEAVECGQKLKQAVGLGAAAAVMLMLTVAECAEYQGATSAPSLSCPPHSPTPCRGSADPREAARLTCTTRGVRRTQGAFGWAAALRSCKTWACQKPGCQHAHCGQTHRTQPHEAQLEVWTILLIGSRARDMNKLNCTTRGSRQPRVLHSSLQQHEPS